MDTAFSTNAEAFEYACTNLNCDIELYKALPAVVMDGASVLKAQGGVQSEPDGTQHAILQVASADGGFLVLARTLGPKGPRLAVGDLVAWIPAQYSAQLAQSGHDERFGWVGVIFGTLEPRREAGSWVGRAKFE
ncbi:MAG: hypothetical protein AAFR04_14980 [Pseudomonadota bacterium]